MSHQSVDDVLVQAIADIMNLHFEEKKAQTLEQFSEVLCNPGNLTRQYSTEIKCFDKTGSPILFGAKIQVDSPFSAEPSAAKVIQLLKDNIIIELK